MEKEELKKKLKTLLALTYFSIFVSSLLSFLIGITLPFPFSIVFFTTMWIIIVIEMILLEIYDNQKEGEGR